MVDRRNALRAGLAAIAGLVVVPGRKPAPASVSPPPPEPPVTIRVSFPDDAATGRQIVAAIRAYERRSGNRWRSL